MSGLDVNGLWLRYGATPVLERVDLHVPAGELVTIVGASGCGKTSFLRLLLGELNPRAGRFCWKASRSPPSRAANAAWCSSAIRSIRT